MKVGIDVRCLSEGRRTGVEEYTLSLLENIFKLDKENKYVLFFNSFKKSKTDFGWAKKYPNVTTKIFRFPNKLLNFLFWYFKWPKIDEMLGGTDIVFMPNIIFGRVSKKSKLVVTIHDLSFERYPKTFSLKRRLWHFFINPKNISRNADKIITVSHSTKNDVVSLYGIKPEKIKVIYSGISEKFRPVDRNNENLVKVKEKYKLPFKYILYLGTIEPRKNIVGIIQAYSLLQEFAERDGNIKLQKYKLVIAGYSGWLSKDIFAEIKKSKFKEKIIVVNQVGDKDKEYFINLASLFVYPSFFEGFGFPPLEAMRCGVPAIVSNNSSLPEIVGRGALMVDPDKTDEICVAMKTVLTSKELFDKLRNDGEKIAQEFNWPKTAREFLKVLNNLK